MVDKSPDPPPAPDPGAMAAAQAAANKEAVRESALVNQINETSPFGSVRFQGEIGTPERERIAELSPEGKAILNQNQELAQLLGGRAIDFAGFLPTERLSFAGLPNAPDIGDFSADRDRFANETFARLEGLLEPGFEEARRNRETELINRGIPVGSEAFAREIERLDRSENEARIAAGRDALAAGSAEQSRLFGLAQAQRGVARDELLAERAAPINELAAFIQGAPATPLPQFQNPAQFQVGAPDILGANALSSQIAAGNASRAAQSNAAALGGLFSLGGSLGSAAIMAPALAASDRRLKTDIRKVGQLDSGLNVYTFRFKGEPAVHMGVMAQEVEAVRPEAVVEISGIKHVDYGQL